MVMQDSNEFGIGCPRCGRWHLPLSCPAVASPGLTEADVERIVRRVLLADGYRPDTSASLLRPTPPLSDHIEGKNP